MKPMISVLIVEDDMLQAEAFKLQLIDCGYRIAALVIHGEDAVEQAQVLAPDVVLMDIVLAGKMEGVEAAQKIRESCDIPVLYLTANADDAFFLRAKVTEPDAYLLKPSTPREIQLVIEIALYRHRAEREARAALEKAVAERTAELEQSHQRIIHILESASDAFISLDRDGCYTYVNAKAGELFGRKPEDLIGRKIWYEFAEGVGQPFYDACHKAVAEQMPVKVEAYCLPWERWFEYRIFPANDCLSVFLHDITERKAAEDAIQNMAFYDPLTQLPNRRLLMDRCRQTLSSSARSDRLGALLFIDLDHFKNLNDTLGHDIGDLLLQQVAQRLTSCVREGDTAARLGGDEFVVMLADLSRNGTDAAAQTEEIGAKILAALSLPYQLGTHKYHSTPSIGATLFHGHQQGIDELFKQADIAMFQAKKAGRNTLRFFDQKMQDSVNARAALESDLRCAIETQQFQLYYQVHVDSARHPLGAEALVRWLHPEKGLILPAQFIAVAEETGLLLPIGLWVLEEACAQLKAWQQQAYTRDLILSVNVSIKQFQQPEFAAQVQAAMQRHAINPGLLKMEITESILLDNVENIITTMNVLNKVGVQFSLDDFGTGYSSLQYLKQLPLFQLKIDLSFVRDIAIDSNDEAIARTINAMARSLNLHVIAEGVETEEQRQILLDIGCTNFQGYLFSKPLPIAQFEALLLCCEQR